MSEGLKRGAVFLDRDGVINRMVLHPEFGFVDSPANPEQMELLPRVGEAIAELNRTGLPVIVVSNQPGIAKGKFTLSLLNAMERKMHAAIEALGGRLDAVYNCLHHPEAALEEFRVRCVCRKPEAGLLLQAARDWNLDLHSSYMIGDGVTDVIAGERVGARTIFLSSRKCYVCESLAEHDARPDYIVGDLLEAARLISSHAAGERAEVERYKYQCEVSR
jgi:D-glycero-D-manno-heptose 1,7-bisphosphate phosphatase